jgi:hypothetical protein
MPKVFLLLLVTNTILSAGIVFQREKITALILACDTLEVQGIYFFANSDTSLASTDIYYPFPVDSALMYPHYIKAVNMSDRHLISYVKKLEGITWNLTMPPHTADSIRIIYRQKALKPSGRYILTTTQYWKKPLEQGDFSVITQGNIVLAYWSFLSDSVSMHNGRIIYRSRQKEFFPAADMMLEWSCEDRKPARNSP